MKTEQAIKKYLEQATADGKSARTTSQYAAYLKHFAAAFADLPTEGPAIESYLKDHKETPAHRGMHFSVLQGLYTYLERAEGVTSPVPPRGHEGRPARAGGPAQGVKLLSNTQGAKLLSKTPGQLDLSKFPVADLIDRYKAFKQAEGVSKRTIEQYDGKLGAFAAAFPVLPLDPDRIAEFLSALKCDQETKWDYRKHIISFYHFLERRQLIPIISINFPRVKLSHKTRRVLDQEEISNLFKVADRYIDKVILTLLIDSKVRASELCNLTRENVYQDHITVTGKTGQRSIPISPLTYKMIDKLPVTKGPVFTIEGRTMKREYLRVHLRGLMEKAGLTGTKLGPHILRHSSSVLHIMHGGDLLSLQSELGHASVKMTEHYAQLAFPEVKQKHKEVNVIGHIITGPDKRGPYKRRAAPAQESGPDKRRALCFGCNHEIEIEADQATKTKCPGCGQVGRWYMPDYSEARK